MRLGVPARRLAVGLSALLLAHTSLRGAAPIPHAECTPTNVTMSNQRMAHDFAVTRIMQWKWCERPLALSGLR